MCCDDVGSPRAVDHDLEPVRRDLAKQAVRVVAREHALLGAERAGELELLLVQIDDRDHARARAPHRLQHQQADRACAVDQRLRGDRERAAAAGRTRHTRAAR